MLLIDNWTNHTAVDNSGSIALTAGKKYALRMEYYESGSSATARLAWSSPSQEFEIIPASQLYAAPASNGDGLKAEYFDNSDFTAKKLTRTDATVNFNWGTSSPVSGVAKDTFSVRWTGYVVPRYSQTYSFFTTSDDGIRVRLNVSALFRPRR